MEHPEPVERDKAAATALAEHQERVGKVEVTALQVQAERQALVLRGAVAHQVLRAATEHREALEALGHTEHQVLQELLEPQARPVQVELQEVMEPMDSSRD
jgi:F420-dependent methylenetetrahydromethanopterin dehydrogenase